MPPSSTSNSEQPAPARHGWFWVLGLVLAGAVAYSNCFTGEFIYDDHGGIVGNPYLAPWTQLRSWADVFRAPSRTTTAGRPFVCLINYLNFALAGLDFPIWRAVNLAIHLLCALILFGIVWRTVRASPIFSERSKNRAMALGYGVALIFLLHPLQTNVVNYVVQRTESLMALYYLATLYFSIRGFQSGRRAWVVAAIATSSLGMISKEVMVSAPLIILCYDWMFNARPIKRALSQSWGLYVGLAGTWLVLATVVVLGKTREGAQWGRLPYTGWEYLLTQADVIPFYLRLSLWPQPLCFDYGWPITRSIGTAAVGLTAVIVLLIATVRAVAARRARGFLGFCFFALLAPSSSFIPLPDAAVEYRMYLPLAPLIVLYVFAAQAVIDAIAERFVAADRRVAMGRLMALAALSGFASVLATLTFTRNYDYHSAVAIWGDVARQRPEHARGHINYGIALAEDVKRGGAANAQDATAKLQLAAAEMARGLQLKPDAENIHKNLGSALAMLGRNREALPHFQAAVAEDPSDASAQFNLANLLSTLGNKDAARTAYLAALAVDPNFRDAHFNLGADFFDAGKFVEAAHEFGEVVRVDPQAADGHLMLGKSLARAGRKDDAETQLRIALRINPQMEEARGELQKLRP